MSRIPLPADPMYRRDKVLALATGDADLEVVSILPKDHWRLDAMAVYYEGATYALVDRQVAPQPKGPSLHRFLLKKVDPETHPFRESCEYAPTEVRELYRRQQATKTSMWVETFPPLWGLLDGKTQNRLANTYESFDPRTATALSIFGEVGVGILSTLFAFWKIGAGQGHWTHGLILVASILMVWEGLKRGGALKAGQITGSVLGRALQPFADGFLKWEKPS